MKLIRNNFLVLLAETLKGMVKTSVAFTLLSTVYSVNAAECQYNIVDEWNNGFKAEISIVNSGDAISDWQLSWEWTDGTTFNHGWNAGFDCSGNACSATPPPWLNQINSGQTFTFGFIGNKGSDTAEQVTVNGDVCDGGNAADPVQQLWLLDGDNSSLQYVSMKKDHTAEINSFLAASGQPAALSGSIAANGDAVLAIDLNDVETFIDVRNSRLLSLLFETEFLPTAYFTASIDFAALGDMQIGSTQLQILSGDFVLHGVSQPIQANVMVAKLSESKVSVSTVQPVNIDSKDFDLAAGIEALRAVAGLSSIGEAVPVYFHLIFDASNAQEDQPIGLPAMPDAPTELMGSFDAANMQANLAWQDNSNDEDMYLVRRRPIDGNWQTIAELAANSDSLIEGLPEAGEFDYKVIALNTGFPSIPSNIERVTVTQGNQVVRGQQLFQNNCAGCHGNNGEGVGSFPAINTERDLLTMIDYIRDFMPQGNAGACDQQCAEDVAAFIQTLWVTEVACDVGLTPVSYGARQLKILTRIEYQNSVEDLVGIDYAVSQGLSEDTKVGFFLNNTYASIVPTSYSNYLLVAEEIAQWSAARDFAPMLSCGSYNQDCADGFISEVAPKIFRRPLDVDEITDYESMANGTHTSGDVKAGIQMALEAMLSSPQFLYRHELGELNPDNPNIDADVYELTSYEMASFLAYTFTGSTPDQMLLDAAANDELRTEAQIVAQAQRLTAEAKGVMSTFVGSWLGTEGLTLAAKDPAVWTGFDNLIPHLENEINETFSYVMLEPNEQFASLYTANYSFLNETLANHYGIAGVTGNDMQKVVTTGRGGILANGAFMARWGEEVETSPILRSVRVRRRMLCQDQPDPPAGTFAAREEKLAELSDLLQDPATTNRLKYHRLTEDTPCTNCHLQYINPLGFGMEDFDTVGRVRSHDLNGNLIDAAGELFAPVNYSDIDQVLPFVGTRGLGTVLAGLESAQACLPKQMFRFVMGVGHQEIDPANPEGTQLSDEEKSSYACEVDELTNTMMNESPRAMLEKFGSLEAVRYRKAWPRN